jgi:hypothetical protein
VASATELEEIHVFKAMLGKIEEAEECLEACGGDCADEQPSEAKDEWIELRDRHHSGSFVEDRENVPDNAGVRQVDSRIADEVDETEGARHFRPHFVGPEELVDVRVEESIVPFDAYLVELWQLIL